MQPKKIFANRKLNLWFLCTDKCVKIMIFKCFYSMEFYITIVLQHIKSTACKLGLLLLRSDGILWAQYGQHYAPTTYHTKEKDYSIDKKETCNSVLIYYKLLKSCFPTLAVYLIYNISNYLTMGTSTLALLIF